MARAGIQWTNYSNFPNMYNLKSRATNQNSTFTSFKSYIDNLVLTGGLLIITLHDIKELATVNLETNTSLLIQILDYAISQGVEVVSASQYSHRLFS